MSERAVSARTKYANNKETDAMPKVMHTVRTTTGREIHVMAADPPDALEIVNEKLKREAAAP